MLIAKVRPDNIFDEFVEVPDDTKKIPSNCTFTLPPEIPDGYFAEMRSGGWKLIEGKKPNYGLIEQRKGAVLTRAEFKMALLEIDELDNVKEAMDDSGVDPRSVILWEDALHFHRTDPDLLRLSEELGYTEEQLDEIFGIS